MRIGEKMLPIPHCTILLTILISLNEYTSGPFLRIFQWRAQLRKGTSRRKGKVEKCSLLGGLGVLPQKMFVFLSSLDLISCNFSMIFTHFQTKRDITRGAKTLQWGGGGQHRGWGGGALAPPVYMLKKALIHLHETNYNSASHMIIQNSSVKY